MGWGELEGTRLAGWAVLEGDHMTLSRLQSIASCNKADCDHGA